MTDSGEVALVLGVLELDFFFRQPVPINRTNQLLILLQQSLAEFLNFLFVHLCSSLSSKTLMVRNREMGVYASQQLCQLARQPVEVQHATPSSFVWKLRGIVIKLSTKSASVNTRRTTSGDYPEQVLCQSQRDSSLQLIRAMNRAFENVLCDYEINRL